MVPFLTVMSNAAFGIFGIFYAKTSMNCLRYIRIIISLDRLTAGASMGGMTALGALARFDWLLSAAALMGSGDFMRLSRTLFPPVTPDAPDYDVFQRLDKLHDRPLLLWHGEADPLVPPAESARDGHHRVRYLTEPDISHKITVGALAATAAFFREAL